MANPAFLEKLKSALKDGLADLGITAEVLSEPVRRTRLYRFYVISNEFEHMQHTERQEVVWRIVRDVLGIPGATRISMVLTLTMDEVGDDELPRSGAARISKSERSTT